MNIPSSRTQTRAQHKLLNLHALKGSWRGVSDEVKFNKGYLSVVARGQKRASPRLLIALGIRHKKHYGQKRRNWQRCCKKVWGIIWGETTATSPPANTN